MASIYVVRHGQASFGSKNYDQLSTLGQQQANRTGEFFREIGLRIDYAIAGDLSRQQETGERVLAHQAGDVSLLTDVRFNEINNEEQIEALWPVICERNPAMAALMDAANSDSKRYQKIIDAVFNAWVSPDCQAEDIQSWTDYRNGVSTALVEVMRGAGAGSNAAIFTSGGTIATLMGLVLGLPSEKVYGFYEPVFNCSVTRFIYSGERISLSSFNDVGHLQLLSAQHGESLVTYR